MAECSICIAEIESGESFTLPCNHAYHRTCLAKCIEHQLKTCPDCREVISDEVKATLYLENRRDSEEQNLGDEENNYYLRIINLRRRRVRLFTNTVNNIEDRIKMMIDLYRISQYDLNALAESVNSELSYIPELNDVNERILMIREMYNMSRNHLFEFEPTAHHEE